MGVFNREEWLILSFGSAVEGEGLSESLSTLSVTLSYLLCRGQEALANEVSPAFGGPCGLPGNEYVLSNLCIVLW